MTSLRVSPRTVRELMPIGISVGLLLSVAYLARGGFGLRPLFLAGVALGGLALLSRPQLGPPIVLLAAMMVTSQFTTGTEVLLNAATLLGPMLLGLWLIRGITTHGLDRIPTPADRVWLLFLAAGLLSLIIGRATWDPGVPQTGTFVIVQIAQWAIFAIAAVVFWLPGLMLRRQAQLERLVWLFLFVGGGLALMRAIGPIRPLVTPITTDAFARAPFWTLVVGLAGGQLLFNRGVVGWRRVYLFALLGLTIFETTFGGRLSISEWVGVLTTTAVLVWLRFPRLRWMAITVLVALILVGGLFPTFYEFAGGQERWDESGGSRMVLIGRVLSVSSRNPLLGLGPAAYRVYAGTRPLPYMGALWFHPQISSHSNYVDLYAHGGLLGLALFGWLAFIILRWALSLGRTARDSFGKAYSHGITAVWAGLLVIMLLADWMLPFVYNIGFAGFQAAILAWLFVGGLALVDHSERAA